MPKEFVIKIMLPYVIPFNLFKMLISITLALVLCNVCKKSIDKILKIISNKLQ